MDDHAVQRLLACPPTTLLVECEECQGSGDAGPGRWAGLNPRIRKDRISPLFAFVPSPLSLARSFNYGVGSHDRRIVTGACVCVS